MKNKNKNKNKIFEIFINGQKYIVPSKNIRFEKEKLVFGIDEVGHKCFAEINFSKESFAELKKRYYDEK